MITSDSLNYINDLELKELILKINKYYTIINKNYKKITPDDNEKEQIIVKRILAEFLYSKLMNRKLVNALDIDSKYKKQLEIFKNLIFYKDDYYYFFKTLIWTEQSKTIFDELIWFLETQNYRNNDFKRISDFINEDNNKQIFRSGKSDYKTINNEINELNKFNNGFVSKDFIEFEKTERALYNKDIFEIEFEYKNKRIGNIGEIISYNDLDKYRINTYFVSRDCGDGFGYDIYTETNTKNLIEVKSTLQKNELDYLKLSENEYNIMLDTFNLNDTNYYIFRVFITLLDNNDYRYSIDPLKPLDENTLLSVNNNYTYNLNKDSKEKIFIKK